MLLLSVTTAVAAVTVEASAGVLSAEASDNDAVRMNSAVSSETRGVLRLLRCRMDALLHVPACRSTEAQLLQPAS
jgi:hypothetical protein